MTRRVALIAALCLCSTAIAQAPQLLGYQGRLVGPNGAPVSGPADLTFSLFTAESGGTPAWSETQTLGLDNGFYATFLGVDAGATLETALAAGASYLELTVKPQSASTAETLAPRQRIGSVAWALNAKSVTGGPVNATSIFINGNPIIDSGGHLAGSAAYTAGSGIFIDAAAQTISVASSGCTSGQVLQWSGSAWACASTAMGGVTSVTGQGAIKVASSMTTPVVSVLTGIDAGTVAAGDDPRFGDAQRIQGRAVSAAAPSSGQVLAFVGGQWVPADAGSTLQGFPISPTAPTAGQTLVFNGTQWAPFSTGSGTSGFVPVWTGSATLGSSSIGASGNNVSIGSASTMAQLQLGALAIMENVNGSQTMVGYNLYHDGTTWRYLTSDGASAVRIHAADNAFGAGGGGISFHVVPDGTAGSVISNMDGSNIRMLIDAQGNVVIGSQKASTAGSVIGGAPSLFHVQNAATYLQPSSSVPSQGLDLNTAGLAVGSNGIIVESPSGWSGNHIKGNHNSLETWRIQQDGVAFFVGVGALSDARLKTNVEPVNDVLGRLGSLRAVRYDFKDPALQRTHGRELGVMAQDLRAQFPELVRETDNPDPKATPKRVLAVDYPRLSAVAVEAARELAGENARLRARVDQLEAQQRALTRYLCGKDPHAPLCRE